MTITVSIDDAGDLVVDERDGRVHLATTTGSPSGVTLAVMTPGEAQALAAALRYTARAMHRRAVVSDAGVAHAPFDADYYRDDE